MKSISSPTHSYDEVRYGILKLTQKQNAETLISAFFADSLRSLRLNLYDIAISLAGFTFACSSFGTCIIRTPSLCSAEIFSESTLSGSVNDLLNEE
jgi:hypothetical protein